MEDILEEIAELVNARRHNGYLSCSCVFHDDKHPSLLIYKKNYICLSCGASGRTSELLRYLSTGTFKQTSNYQHFPSLWSMFKHKEIDEIVDEAEHVLQKFSDNRYYLRKRGIDDHLINKLRIGYLHGWYTFPIMDKYKYPYGLVARAGETLQKHYDVRYIVPPGQEAFLYIPNQYLVDQHKFVFMVFGILDAITLSSIGFPAISPSMGHNIKKEELDKIRKKILIIPDGDGKDERTVSKLLSDLDWRGTKLNLDYPENTKDVNDILCNFSSQYLKNTINQTMTKANLEKLWD